MLDSKYIILKKLNYRHRVNYETYVELFIKMPKSGMYLKRKKLLLRSNPYGIQITEQYEYYHSGSVTNMLKIKYYLNEPD